MTTLIVAKPTKSRNAPPTFSTFLEILSRAELRPGDLEIITEATDDQPGQAKLVQAHIGEAQPAAPKSRPLLSQTRAKIGFVAEAELIAPPFNDAYWVVEAARDH